MAVRGLTELRRGHSLQRKMIVHSRLRWRPAVASLFALILLAACTGGTSGLVGPTWQWTFLTEHAPMAHSDVGDPGRYTLTLADDGSFQVKADCNTVAGTYVTDGDEITLTPG